MAISSGGTGQPEKRKNATSLPIDDPLHDGVVGDENTSAGHEKAAKGKISEMLKASSNAKPKRTSTFATRYLDKIGRQAPSDRDARIRELFRPSKNARTSKLARIEPKDFESISTTTSESHPWNDILGKKVENSSTTVKPASFKSSPTFLSRKLKRMAASSESSPTKRTPFFSRKLQPIAFPTSPESHMVGPVPSPRSMTGSHAGESPTPTAASTKSSQSPTKPPASPLLNRSILNGGFSTVPRDRTGTSLKPPPAFQDAPNVARMPSPPSSTRVRGHKRPPTLPSPGPKNGSAQQTIGGNKPKKLLKSNINGPRPETCKLCNDALNKDRKLGCRKHKSMAQIIATEKQIPFGKNKDGSNCRKCISFGAYCKDHVLQDKEYQSRCTVQQQQPTIIIQPTFHVHQPGGGGGLSSWNGMPQPITSLQQGYTSQLQPNYWYLSSPHLTQFGMVTQNNRHPTQSPLGAYGGVPHWIGMPPQAMPHWMGMPPQAMPFQGMPQQGMPPPGMPQQGMPQQGMPPPGMPQQGIAPQQHYANQA